MSSLSKSSKSIKDKINPKQENARKQHDPSYIHQVEGKVRLGHPSMIDQEEIKELSRRICSPEELITYFDFDETIGSEPRPMADRPTLPVQLILKYYRQAVADVGPVEKILRNEYGPLRTYLVIGDQILEWNWKSMVIPHGRPIADGSGRGAESGSISDLPPITIDELKKVMKLAAEWNRLTSYDSIKRNSQDFVRTVLQTLCRPSPVELETKIAGYYNKLESVREPSIPGPDRLKSHEDLDQFVLGNLGKFDEGGHGAEYLFSRYFLLHIKSQMMSENPISWKCQEPNCKMRFIEGVIDQDKMILKDYKTRYDFHHSITL